MRAITSPTIQRLAALLAAAVLSGCGQVWNDPYPAAERGGNILYTAFSQRPKHLDPVQSYSEDEATFLYQIYEPPLQYHYLKRPFQLQVAAAAQMPTLRQFDAAGRLLPAGADPASIARSEYEIRIQPGIRYQPHPAFAVDAAGKPLYLDLPPEVVATKRSLADFPQTGTRELTAEDYIYQIKRLAHPRLHSPVLELMGDYIVGLKDLHARLVADEKARSADGQGGSWIDLRSYPMAGVELVDRYTYRVHIKGTYPQFPYWLAMPFFAPMPVEAERFFAQPGMAERNLTLDWWPIGTGPYMLVENNPNARMVLARNPNFRGERYPCEGEPDDQAAGLLADCGKPIPFIDKVVFSREKESIPAWNKFLQGYYDASGVSSDNFDQAVQMGGQGDVTQYVPPIAIAQLQRTPNIRMSQQPNYFWEGQKSLSQFFSDVKANGLGMEFEFDEALLEGNPDCDTYKKRFREYMSGARLNNVYGTKPLSYYHGTNALYDLSKSTAAKDREFYHEFCRFVLDNPMRK